jgi:predicted amidohydrolase
LGENRLTLTLLADLKLGVAQVKPFSGDIDKNITSHKKLIARAVSEKTDLIVFPELSLTGYEPRLCKELATHADDNRLDDFQTISNTGNITICLGLPTISNAGIRISMIIFQPYQPRQTYSKQHLHADELPYFTSGNHQTILTINHTKFAPAICYESLLPKHSHDAFQLGAEIYVASVAKSANGVAKAFAHYPAIAKKYAMLVFMSNCTGPCDDFESVGRSSIWNKSGLLLAQLDETTEGILLLDAETSEITKCLETT